jgi:hypothetical protein
MNTVVRIVIPAATSRWARRVALVGLPVVATLVAGVAIGVPKTFSPGEKLTAAALNQNFSAVDASLAALDATGKDLDGRVTDLEQKTRISVQGYTGGGTIPSLTFTKIPYKTVEYDDLGEFDPATSTFTPKYAGDYQVCSAAFVSFGNVTNRAFEVDLFVDGVRDNPSYAAPGATGGTATVGTGCDVVRLAAGAKLDVRVYQSSGSPATLMADGFWDYLRSQRL